MVYSSITHAPAAPATALGSQPSGILLPTPGHSSQLAENTHSTNTDCTKFSRGAIRATPPNGLGSRLLYRPGAARELYLCIPQPPICTAPSACAHCGLRGCGIRSPRLSSVLPMQCLPANKERRSFSRKSPSGYPARAYMSEKVLEDRYSR